MKTEFKRRDNGHTIKTVCNECIVLPDGQTVSDLTNESAFKPYKVSYSTFSLRDNAMNIYLEEA